MVFAALQEPEPRAGPLEGNRSAAFPGALFCPLHPFNRFPILTIPGVARIVGAANNPIAIEETEIAAIQTAVKSGLPSQPWPFLQVGRRVRIEYGPLCEI